jgi:hypothetical protein
MSYENESWIHESVKEKNEIHAGFTVTFQAQEIMASV